MLLTREQVRKSRARLHVDVYVPELEGELRIAALPAGPALTFNNLQERLQKGESVERQLMLLLLQNAVIDEKGNAFFDPTTAEKFLDSCSQETLSLLVDELKKLSATETKPAGNSEASPTDG